MTPIWITVKDGDDIIFEGHQMHWANCFFSNATRENIEECARGDSFLSDCTYEIREMSDEDVEQHPELREFLNLLFEEYGTI